jgi:hypothetical protein
MILISEKMTSQTITDEFIYVSVQGNNKKHMNNVKLKQHIDEFRSGTTNITQSEQVGLPREGTRRSVGTYPIILIGEIHGRSLNPG